MSHWDLKFVVSDADKFISRLTLDIVHQSGN